MSYDVHLVIDTGGEHPACLEDYNYTYNCGPMFRKALGGDGLHMLEDLTCCTVTPLLRIAVANMEADPEAYEAMNPPNGWGSYAGALKFLQSVLAGCEAHPKATVLIR